VTNIFLIGYRCTGKTTVGREVAQQIGATFVDADERLMKNTGETVAAIVSRGGWSLFRRLEKQALKEICTKRGQVVATGGGIVTDPDNIEMMKQHGAVVWLHATPETIYSRMSKDEKTGDLRPSLTDYNLKEEIEKTLSERISLYERAMTFEVDTDRKSYMDIAREIISRLSEAGHV
jgi:shikimate kinase